MNLLRIHIAKTVAMAMALVMVIIVGLNFLTVLADQFDDIHGLYTFGEVFKYASWRLPGMGADSIGFVAMIGCLVGLGMLANHNELTVMRASGISLLQIVGMVMLPVMMLIALGLGLEELAAYTDRHAENARTTVLFASYTQKNMKGDKKPMMERERIKQAESLMQEKGVWNREANEFVRFDKVLPDGRVYGVTRVAFDENKQIVSLQHARKGFFENDGWRLEEVTTRYFAEEYFSEEFLGRLRWDSSLTPERLLFISEEPENLAVHNLADYSSFLQEQGRDNRVYQLEYWKRILQPVSLLSLVLIAVSFVFGSLRQVSVAQRVFIGVIIAVSFHILQDIMGTSSLVFGFSPLSAVLLPILACAFAGLALLYRVR